MVPLTVEQWYANIASNYSSLINLRVAPQEGNYAWSLKHIELPGPSDTMDVREESTAITLPNLHNPILNVCLYTYI